MKTKTTQPRTTLLSEKGWVLMTDENPLGGEDLTVTVSKSVEDKIASFFKGAEDDAEGVTTRSEQEEWYKRWSRVGSELCDEIRETYGATVMFHHMI